MFKLFRRRKTELTEKLVSEIRAYIQLNMNQVEEDFCAECSEAPVLMGAAPWVGSASYSAKAKESAPVESMSEEMMPRASMAPASSKRSLSELVNKPEESFSEMLMRLITERGLKASSVYKRANLDKRVFSKIKGNPSYQPKKNTAIAFAIALRLSLDETKDLLLRAGYALSPSSSFDLAIRYFIEHGFYDIFEIEIALDELGLPALCNY